MRSEEEIRTAVRHFIASDEGFLAAFIEGCCIEQMQTIEAAIAELLALRRRMDRERIGKLLFSRFNHQPYSWDSEREEIREYLRRDADAIIKYLEGADGER